MNVTALALSMMAFGVMIGITSTHFLHVHHLVEHGVPALVSPVKTPVDAPQRERAADPLPDSGKSISLAASDTAAQAPVMPKVINKGSDREDALLEILAAMRDDQRSLRKQISESNRDLDELSFRVDTHSDSFKPLQTEVDRPRSLNQMAEPLDAAGASLLPPKQ